MQSNDPNNTLCRMNELGVGVEGIIVTEPKQFRQHTVLWGYCTEVQWGDWGGGGGGGVVEEEKPSRARSSSYTNPETPAEPQRIVVQDYSHSLQYRVPKLSHLQRIHHGKHFLGYNIMCSRKGYPHSQHVPWGTIAGCPAGILT